MEWTDSGIVLGARKHGETSLILELLTARHGRHLGLVRGGRSKRLAAVIQPGNSVIATWSARIEDALGVYRIEGDVMRAGALIESGPALYATGYVASLVRLLPERDAQEGLHEALTIVLDHLDAPEVAAPLVVRFEVAMLSALGFGLDLTQCASSGARENLTYVSPKTGRAVSREAGEPWRDRLLPLPGFLAGRPGDNVSPESLREGFRLTRFFLDRHVYEPRGLAMPDQREAFVAAVTRAEGA